MVKGPRLMHEDGKGSESSDPLTEGGAAREVGKGGDDERNGILLRGDLARSIRVFAALADVSDHQLYGQFS